MNQSYAAGFYRMLDIASELNLTSFKGHITGPISFGLGISRYSFLIDLKCHSAAGRYFSRTTLIKVAVILALLLSNSNFDLI